MDFTTKVDISSGSFKMRLPDKSIMLGSCFAEKIGNMMRDYQMDCVVNPFGVLYNPISIFQIIRFSLSDVYDDEIEKYVFCHESNPNKWFSFLHSTLFQADSREECREMIMRSLHELQERLRVSQNLFITLGTNHCYNLKSEKPFCVSNCHKLPSKMFDELVADVEDIVGMGKDVIQRLRTFNKEIRIVFTVSPYRYAKYGFHENQLSKSCLLLSIDKLQKEFSGVYYFPAYEIVNDELRDYRYYADDMLHVSSVATDYIWDCFKNNWTDNRTQEFIRMWEPIKRGLEHRPSNPESKEYKDFLQKLQVKKLEAEKYKNDEY